MISRVIRSKLELPPVSRVVHANKIPSVRHNCGSPFDYDSISLSSLSNFCGALYRFFMSKGRLSACFSAPYGAASQSLKVPPRPPYLDHVIEGRILMGFLVILATA